MKRCIILWLVVFLLILVCGCSQTQTVSSAKGVSEHQLVNDLTELTKVRKGIIDCPYIPKDANYTLDNYKIVKRQTNIDCKQDNIYCEITISNQYVQTVMNYSLNYNFYDIGGWVLDDFTLENYNSVPLKGVSLDLVETKGGVSLDPVEFRETLTEENLDIIYFCYENDYYVRKSYIKFLFDQKEGWSLAKHNLWSADITLKKENIYQGKFEELEDEVYWNTHSTLELSDYDKNHNTVTVKYDRRYYNKTTGALIDDKYAYANNVVGTVDSDGRIHFEIYEYYERTYTDGYKKISVKYDYRFDQFSGMHRIE